MNDTKEVFKIKAFWGSQHKNIEDEYPLHKLLDNKLFPPGENGVREYEFTTLKELKAFVQGVEESNGWDHYNLIEI